MLFDSSSRLRRCLYTRYRPQQSLKQAHRPRAPEPSNIHKVPPGLQYLEITQATLARKHLPTVQERLYRATLCELHRSRSQVTSISRQETPGPPPGLFELWHACVVMVLKRCVEDSLEIAAGTCLFQETASEIEKDLLLDEFCDSWEKGMANR